MENYKKAWETSDEFLLASLFTEDGRYHNTPFSVQAGHAQIRQYWQRTKLRDNIALTYEILHADALSGIAHWHTTCQVTSEDMFALWAASTAPAPASSRESRATPCRAWPLMAWRSPSLKPVACAVTSVSGGIR